MVGGGTPDAGTDGGITGGTAFLTLCVNDDQGHPITNGFRWLIEEDNSFNAQPGVATPNAAYGSVPGNPSYTLSVNIHRSHAPTVCAGDTAPSNEADSFPPADITLAGPGAACAQITSANCPGYNPAKRYMASVLPWHTSPGGTAPGALTGFTMSGHSVEAGQTHVDVLVHPFPVPTAQITVIVFHDNQPVNAAYDLPAETGLPGFSLLLTDPIGRVDQDAWGNPMGTTYKYACAMPDGRPAAGTVDSSGNVTCTSTPLTQEQQPIFRRDPDTGLPVVDFMGDGNLYVCPGNTKPLSQYTPYENANCFDPYTLTPLDAGEAVIRFLAANKYTVEPVPPRDDTSWLLTGTLEGTRGNDAWVRSTEPRYNIDLGQLNWLVFFGFVQEMDNLASVPNPTGAALGSVTGQLVYVHDMHPPLQPGLSPGLPVLNGYVAVNNLNGNDEQIYTAACDPATGEFSISGLVPGDYQLAFWDIDINAIIDYRTITVLPGQTVALGPVAVYRWFGTYKGSVFTDTNQNGFRDPLEVGIANVPVSMHYTDGSLYGSTQTDSNGDFTFQQYFAWWRYLVADVDYTRFKPTGLTAFIDNGGPLPPTPLGDQGINPQIQPDGQDHRTQLPSASDPAITQAINNYQDMTARIDWGKVPWGDGENGGVFGTVNYALTRTEEDPSESAIDPWEPSIPRVTVRLHQAVQDTTHGDPNAGYLVIRDTGAFPLTTTTTSWDDSNPTGCIGSQGTADQGPLLWANPEEVNGLATPSCAESFVNWDQTRPGVKDGDYYFRALPDGSPIPPGQYIVEVVPPTGYEVLQWGDRNIDFGDPKVPYLLEPPICVGPSYQVPPYRRWFPDQQLAVMFPNGWDNGVWTNPTAASCNEKYIALNPGSNQNVNFNLFTWVPKSSRIWGTVWNDLMLEFNPRSPNASGNLGVGWLPVALKDWSGNEVARYYTDQWGHFDGLLPANYDIAPPIPLGLVLSMYTVAPNDPGPIVDRRPSSPTYGQRITDPWFQPQYSQEVIRENWEFYSGKTTFIDTIVLPVSGFNGNRDPLNCDQTDGTPEIRQVSDVIIPQVPGGFTITITSVGPVTGPNPYFDPTNPASPATVTWDHSFGATPGTLTVGGTQINPANLNWAADGLSLTAKIPNGVSGQLLITRADTGKTTGVGVYLRPSTPGVPVFQVNPPPSNCVGTACRVIQPAVDAAPPGAVVVINPGVYQEYVTLWKPLSLQGKGAAVTKLDGTFALANFPAKQAAFDEQQALIASGAIGIVPNQASDFTLEQGAGILVAGCGTSPSCGPTGGGVSSFYAPGASARIDGLAITGSTEAGGGVLVNGFAPNVTISNNDIWSNQGSIGGGIRVGEGSLVGAGNPTGSNFNPNVAIEHNRIAQNGSLFSGGGGIAIYAGSDNYRIDHNDICGNFSAQYGGGIGHFGLSDHGQITHNVIVANESFDEGGGIHLGGDSPLAGATTMTLGAGSVLVQANLIQGNKGGDDGGGLRTLKFNGQDVASNPSDPSKWFQLDVLDNLILDNSSADTGGGLAFDDAVKVNVIGNTIAHNDSTATSSDAFGNCTENSPEGQVCLPGEVSNGGLQNSVPQVAGISAAEHSDNLEAALATPGGYCATHGTDPICSPYANPKLVDDIIWQNRSFYWDASANNGLGALLPTPGRTYWDLAVYPPTAGYPTPPPGNGRLSPSYCILTDNIGSNPDPTNKVGTDPRFWDPYFDVYQATSKGAALGNFVVATFTPNGVLGNYSIDASSPAVGAGSAIPPGTTTDYTGAARSSPVDIGALQSGSTFRGVRQLPAPSLTTRSAP